MQNSYKDSGVDIEAGEKTVDNIKEVVKSTFNRNVITGLGHFGAFYELDLTGYIKPVLVSSVDGVGTKLKVAIDWCEENDFEVKHKFIKKSDDYIKQIIKDEYTLGKISYYTIDYVDEVLPVRELSYDYSYVFDNLKKIKTKLYHFHYIIDTREQRQWKNVSKKIKLYDDIKYYLKYQYNIINTSNAWVKLYEILSTFPLINENNKTFKTFNMCEAPGSWIFCLNHYLKTHTTNEDFDWTIQSLNPNEPSNRKYGAIFADDYGLMKKYPERWKYGVLNTGDITEVENIKSYGKIVDKDIDLITSDCGIRVAYDKDKEVAVSKLNLAQVIMILSLLPVGKHCVLKTYIPFSEMAVVNWLYILFCSFDKMTLCKPLTSHPSSEEVYIVCMGYKGISENFLNYLYSCLENFDIKKGLLPIKTISNNFLKQLEELNDKYVKKTIYSLNRTFFYYDNYDEFYSENSSRIEKIKKQNSVKWSELYDVREKNYIDI